MSASKSSTQVAKVTKKTPPRTYPPIESCAGDVGQWLWKMASPVYRRRVKRANQMVRSYRMMAFGSSHLSRAQKDAVHRLLDTLTFDAARRTRRGGGATPEGVSTSAPVDPLTSIGV